MLYSFSFLSRLARELHAICKIFLPGLIDGRRRGVVVKRSRVVFEFVQITVISSRLGGRGGWAVEGSFLREIGEKGGAWGGGASIKEKRPV